MDFRKVKVADIGHNPPNRLLRPVPQATDPKVVDYRASIEAVGVLNIFSLRQAETGEYYVNDGNHRLVAIKLNLLEPEKYPNTAALFPDGEGVFPIYDKNEQQSLIAQIAGNFHTSKPSPKQISAAVQSLMLEGLTIKDCAEMLSMSEATLDKYIVISRLPENVRDMVEEGKIGISNAFVLATLPEETRKSSMAAWVDKAMKEDAVTFSAEAAKEDKAVRAARRGKSTDKKQFVPEARLLKKAVLDELFARAEAEFAASPESIEARIRFEVFKEIFSLDEVSVQRQKEDFEKAAKEAEDKKKEREQARIKKDEEDLAKRKAELGLE